MRNLRAFQTESPLAVYPDHPHVRVVGRRKPRASAKSWGSGLLEQAIWGDNRAQDGIHPSQGDEKRAMIMQTPWEVRLVWQRGIREQKNVSFAAGKHSITTESNREWAGRQPDFWTFPRSQTISPSNERIVRPCCAKSLTHKNVGDMLKFGARAKAMPRLEGVGRQQQLRACAYFPMVL